MKNTKDNAENNADGYAVGDPAQDSGGSRESRIGTATKAPSLAHH